MADFTPGPWRVVSHTSRISVTADALVRPHKKTGGRVGGMVAHTPVSPQSMQAPQALANARLIAAAPELYEALDEALDMVLRAAQCGDYSVEAFARCKAALARATQPTAITDEREG